MTADTPPPRLRQDVTERERRSIETALGPIPDDDLLRAVRDGRGRQFQRLEFLGDSVLDVVLAVHRWIETSCARCAGRETLPEASDSHLAQVAEQAGLGSWLEWRASDERFADLVETCVAACWLTGRWPQTAQFITSVVHPIGEPTVRSLTAGGAGEPGRAARRVGSAILELAAASGVYLAMPSADEGELSTARATLHRASAIAAEARVTGDILGSSVIRGDDDTVLSQVEDALADTLGASGADASLVAAQPFVPTASG
jgi:dsRNA-specific ribonuclease